MKKIDFGLFLIPLALLTALIFGPILRNGMFLDGLVYTNIARNLANDVGSIWAPLVFRHGEVFYEHPVLLPFVASWFFRLFGDGLFVEDLYNFTILTGTTFFLYRIWVFSRGGAMRPTFFFPFLLWVLNQEVQLRYPNTMLECGTALVLLATTYLYLTLRRRIVLAGGIVGLGVFVAVLCKGPFGLFLLGLPLLHRLIVGRCFSWRALLVPVFAFAACFCILFSLEPAALSFFQQYFDQQVLAAVAGRRVENIATTRFDFLYWLFILNLPALALALLVFLVKTEHENQHQRLGLLFLAVGTTGILPLAISIKQAAYYQLVALPFFVLGISFLLLPKIREVVSYASRQKATRRIVTFTGVIGLLVAGGIAVSMVGTTDRRDTAIIELTHKIAPVFEAEGTVNYQLRFLGNEQEAAQRSYRLTNFLNRYHNIHLDQTTHPSMILYLRSGDHDTNIENILFNEDGVIISRR